MSIIGPGGANPVTIRDRAAAAIIELPMHLREIGVSLQQLATQGELHIYSISEARTATDGTVVWGAWCYACSEAVNDYVFPCTKEAPGAEQPPRMLVPLVDPPAPPPADDQATS